MKKIIIASDSTTDLSEELIRKYDIRILPMIITLGDHDYFDFGDLTPDQIYQHYEETGELPKTSAINLVRFEKFFAELRKEAESVIFFTLSSEMSSSFNNARTVALDDENVYVVDGQNLSTGGGLLVLKAAEMAEAGLSATEIVEKCQELVPCVDASFVIDDLEYLKAGGRVSALSANAASMLNIKPCIMVRNGKMIVGRKYHGKLKVVVKKYVNEIIEEAGDIDREFGFITHSGCDKQLVDEVYRQVSEMNIFDKIFITRAGCTVSSHCGPDTIGVLFIRKNPIC
ncbi:MAG: DegV family protein [Erysipelotrichaceae bacterium]|nr:DegV family protein [Erysipelotrichaceae bacterium]